MNSSQKWAYAVAVGTGAVLVSLSGCSSAPEQTAAVPAPTSSAAASSGASGSSVPMRECPAAGPRYKDGVYSGTKAEYKYGDLTVDVTVASGCVRQVTAAMNATGYSKQLQSKAEPVLKESVLQANSAQISTVSGATYTSQAYKTSLQAALDQAR